MSVPFVKFEYYIDQAAGHDGQEGGDGGHDAAPGILGADDGGQVGGQVDGCYQGGQRREVAVDTPSAYP